MTDDLYIWINRWDEFQTYHKKRDKIWAPPWIKLYPRLLTDPDFLALTESSQLILVKLFMLFSKSRQSVSKDTRMLSHLLHQRVTNRQLESLNHAGYISFCSRTVLEQRRAAFWNRSIRDVEVEEDKELSEVHTEASTPSDDIDFGADLARLKYPNIPKGAIVT